MVLIEGQIAISEMTLFDQRVNIKIIFSVYSTYVTYFFRMPHIFKGNTSTIISATKSPFLYSAEKCQQRKMGAGRKNWFYDSFHQRCILISDMTMLKFYKQPIPFKCYT